MAAAGSDWVMSVLGGASIDRVARVGRVRWISRQSSWRNATRYKAKRRVLEFIFWRAPVDKNNSPPAV